MKLLHTYIFRLSNSLTLNRENNLGHAQVGTLVVSLLYTMLGVTKPAFKQK